MFVEGAVQLGTRSASFWNNRSTNNVYFREDFVIDLDLSESDSFDKVSISVFDIDSGGEIMLSNFKHSIPSSPESFFDHVRSEKGLKIAVWYNRERRQLLLARDLFGLVPLYYTKLPGGVIAFSTRLSSLLSRKEIRSALSINDRVLHSFHAFHAPFGQRLASDSFYNGINSVLPGHILSFSAESESAKPFVFFDLSRWKGLNSSEEYELALRDLFADSVRQVAQGAQIGMASHLSGGLDSSSVSAMHRHVFPEKALHTLHHRSETSDMDESDYAKAVADHIGSIHHETSQSKEDFLLIQRHTAQYGQPEAAKLSSSLITSMMPLAKQLNCNYLLRGNGGDSVIGSGMEALEAAFTRRDWGELESLLRRRVAFSSLSSQYPRWETYSFQQQYEVVLQDFLYKRLSTLRHEPVNELLTLFTQIYSNLGISAPYFAKRIIGNYFKKIAKTNVSSPLSILREDYVTATRVVADTTVLPLSRSILTTAPSRFKGLFDEIFAPEVIYATEQQFVLGSYYKLKSRSPFLNKEILELCMAVPDVIKYGEGRGREHFREAMKGLLPEVVRCRSGKSTLASAHGQRMTLRLYQQALPLLNESRHVWQYIDRLKFDEQVAVMKNDKIPYAQKVRSWFHITRAVSLATWLDWYHGLSK